jgi:hypothetical protein
MVAFCSQVANWYLCMLASSTNRANSCGLGGWVAVATGRRAFRKNCLNRAVVTMSSTAGVEETFRWAQSGARRRCVEVVPVVGSGSWSRVDTLSADQGILAMATRAMTEGRSRWLGRSTRLSTFQNRSATYRSVSAANSTRSM